MQASSRRAFLVSLGAVAAGTTGCSAGRTEGSAASSPKAPPSTARPTSGSPSPTATRPGAQDPTASGADLVHGPRDVPAVALTFHGAGDPSLTRGALAALAAADAKVTVMAVGTWLQQNPSLARAVLDAGHELGNHTWSHQAMRRLGPVACRTEIARAKALITELAGTPVRWFRPSGTPTSTATIRAAALTSGYDRCLSYDVDPLDYTDPGAAAVTRGVLSAVRPGSIVSLHLGHAGTVAALPDVLAGLADRGLRAVTTSSLVQGRA